MAIHIDHSERLTFSSISLSRTIHLNEVVAGQDEKYITDSLGTSQEKLSIQFQDFYVLLTGLKKEIYTNVYHLDANQYMKLYAAAEEHISRYLSETGFRHEIFLFCYFNTKQICILFNRDHHTDEEVENASVFINDLIQSIYEQEIFKGERRYFNFTTLSPLLASYGDLAPAFKRIQELGRLSFFHMAPAVMTESALVRLRRSVSYQTIQSLVGGIVDRITAGQVEEAGLLSKELFLERLKNGYSFSLCYDTLAELKRQVYRYNTIFDLNLESGIERVFTLENYANIEELFLSVDRVLSACAQAARRKGKGIGYISQEAIKFMKDNYSRNISLRDIASYVNVVPNYLSCIFNKEVGKSIPEYLSSLRIDRAKKLFLETNLKVFEVAEEVGIQDPNYFGKIFKRMEGVTPREYRLAYSFDSPAS